MTLSRNSYVFGALAGLAIIAASVLVALGHPVPDFIAGIAIAAVSALAGVSIPTSSSTGPAELAAALQAAARSASVDPTQPYAQPTATGPVGVTPAISAAAASPAS